MPLIRQPEDPASPKRAQDAKGDKRDELLQELSDAEPLAQRVESLGQSLIGSARLVRDVAGPTRAVFLQVPADALSEDDWSRQLEAWRALKQGAAELNRILPTMVNTFGALSTGATTASTQAIAVVVQGGALPPAGQAAAARVWQTLERSPLAERARASMQRLGLRGGPSWRSPLELLNEAQAALERPASGDVGTTSVLLPVRECIDAALAELLRHRPTPEPARNLHEKITSLGRQGARPGLRADHFNRLATDADAVHRNLSEAKQARLSRDQVNQLFHRAVLVLNALMDAIDEGRLR